VYVSLGLHGEGILGQADDSQIPMLYRSVETS
jgi:hypothetical protein